MSAPPAWLWFVCPPAAAAVALAPPPSPGEGPRALPVTEEVQESVGVDLEEMR